MMKNETSCWLLAVLMRADPLEEDEYCACIIIKLGTGASPKPLRVAGTLYTIPHRVLLRGSLFRGKLGLL